MNTIVVGVDGSPESLAALRYAYREALARGDRVRAVAAWHIPAPAYNAGLVSAAPNPSDFEEAARDLLDQALAATAADAEGVTVEGVVRKGEAAHVLVEEAATADQLVVGCHSFGFLRTLLHHSVSGQCAHEARCPVTVVHGG